jgi:hypothetical protein
LVFASFGVAFTETNAALDHFEQGCSPRGRAVWYWPNRPFVISKQATVTDSLMATADREPTSEPYRFPPSGTSLSPLGPSSPPLGPFLLDSGGRGERRPGRPPAFLESRRGLSVIARRPSRRAAACQRYGLGHCDLAERKSCNTPYSPYHSRSEPLLSRIFEPSRHLLNLRKFFNPLDWIIRLSPRTAASRLIVRFPNPGEIKISPKSWR